MEELNTHRLSEQDIKQIALQYLKRYYKKRFNSQDIEVASDVRGKGGIVADGFLYYSRPEGGQFIAAFEATSYDTRMEVRFTPRNRLLWLDSLVFALWGTAVGGIVQYALQLTPIKKYGPILPWVMFLSVFTTLLFGFRMLAAGWRRYRKIYAVEQFKQYHIDEQWIAVSTDVFFDPADPHYEELYLQCIHFGFGLIMIDSRGRLIEKLTPAREDVFGGRRQRTIFYSRFQWMKAMQDRFNHPWLKELMGRMGVAFDPADPRWLDRFRKSRPKHWAAAAIALAIIVAVWYREYDAWLYRSLSPQEYAELVSRERSIRPPDPGDPDPDTLLRPWPFQDNRISYLDEWIEERLAQKSARLWSEQNAVGWEDGSGITYYDCARFRNFEGEKYILVEGVYPDFAAAALRVEQLQSAGVPSISLWLGCFHERSREFVVFFSPICNSPQEALRMADALERLRRPGSSKDFLTVKAIRSK